MLRLKKNISVVSEHVRQKPSCTSTEDGHRLEIWVLESKGIVLFVAKTKALISFAVTAKLICAYVFAYADRWFCHDVAHLLYTVKCIWFSRGTSHASVPRGG